MESRFTAILKVVGTCARAEGETQSVLAELEETVRRMFDSVGEIREIEIRIPASGDQCSTVRAVQIGDAGNALSVIAEVMQRLALDANSTTETVAKDLDAIGNIAGGLSGGAGGTLAPEESETDRALRDALRDVRTAFVE